MNTEITIPNYFDCPICGADYKQSTETITTERVFHREVWCRNGHSWSMDIPLDNIRCIVDGKMIRDTSTTGGSHA